MVSLSGSRFKSVGLYEAHEIPINMHLKMSLSRPPKLTSQLLKTNTLKNWSLNLKNLRKQLDLGPRNIRGEEASQYFGPHKNLEKHI
jgi:hypothetical protein